MDPIYKLYDIYLMDYITLFDSIMRLNLRIHRLKGVNAVNQQYKIKELDHAQLSLDLLNCEFLKRYHYMPIFLPT